MGTKRTTKVVSFDRPEENEVRCRPALTPEARQAQLESLAYDLVESRIRNGTATSQEVVFFLKSGSTREKEEIERLRVENELAKAKIMALENQQRSEEIAAAAIKAMQEYRGVELTDEQSEVYVSDEYQR